MRKCLRIFFAIVMACLPATIFAQVTLTGSSYSENFAGIGTNLPNGFSIYTGATASALGTVGTFATAHTNWTATGGKFANFASGNIGSSATTTQQAAATDRALGIRQTGTFGDPGAAFVFQIANTTNMTGFNLDFKLQSLDGGSARGTLWRVEYGFGATPSSFTAATVTGTLTTGNGLFSNNAIHADFGTGLNNQSGVVTIRIVTLDASSGSGSRASTAIDDFVLSWTNGGGGASPVLGVDNGTLTFPVTETNTVSSPLTYKLTATDLTNNVSVSAVAPYSVSLDNINYYNFLPIDKDDAELVAGKTIYVKFSPTSVGTFAGSVTNSSTGATAKVVGVSGTAVSYIHLNTSPYSENFDDIGSGLPAGLTVRTGATVSSLGTGAPYIASKTTWSSTGGGFYNYASGNIGSSESQSTATDRAVGLRQTGSVGDPGGAFVFQIANTTGKINFTMDFNLQSLDATSTRTTTWRVDYGLGSNPTSFIVPTTTGTLTTGGSTFSDNPIHVDFGNALDDYTGIITVRIVTVAASSGSSNRPTSAIDDLSIAWENSSGKTISINTTALNFTATNTGSNTVRSYTILGQTNLDQPIVVTATGPFTVSTDNINFYSTLNIVPADATNKVVYVKFAPVAAGVFSGQVTNTSTGASTKTVLLSAEAIDPAALSFNFNTCTVSSIPGSGFLSINTVGSQQWGCSQYGRNSTNGVSVNGYVSGAQNNVAWLISPKLNLSGIAFIPALSFYSRGEYTGPKLKLLVSTDYDGSSSPSTATWTEITSANFPTPPGSATTDWTLSEDIDLSAYKGLSNVYIAFQYTSSPTDNAARWSIDDVTITDQSTLLSVSPVQLSFGEVSTGNHSAGQAVTVKSDGGTNITVTPPTGYELSSDNSSFSTNPLVIPAATAGAGTTIYVRFSPVAKALKVEGTLNFSAPGLNKNNVTLTGSSYPKAETFDVACYNMSFFGANSTNSATPAEVTTQVNNITTVINRLNMDVIGFEEMSNDAALTQLLSQLSGSYAATVSNRWSYSFNAPDPTFPPQKIGFIYNTATMTLSAAEPPRVMFESMYDSARLGLPGARLGNYPTGSGSSFWSSGRLPYMATFDVNINGQTKKVRLIVIHSKSSSDQASYNRRVYDVQVLKDSVDLYYKNDNVMIIGDYNDRVEGSIYTASTISPYKSFVDDNGSYTALTRPLDIAGRVSFIGGSGLIDHMIITRPLLTNNISNSTDIEDPRLYIATYTATTASDHLPVYTRFSFATPLPVTLLELKAQSAVASVLVSWKTGTEQNSSHFNVLRSADGTNFTVIGRVSSARNSNSIVSYQFNDVQPLSGTSYYRLQQVDIDGKATLSQVVSVRRNTEEKAVLSLQPNPVTNVIRLVTANAGKIYTVNVTGVDGRVVLRASGDINQVNSQLNNQLGRLKPGMYILSADNASEHYTLKFIRQ